MTKHTQGPLEVREEQKFPFRIQIINHMGDIVFSEDRYALSTQCKSSRDCMVGVGFSQGKSKTEAVKGNERQLADSYLRAAAPELLEALEGCISDIESEGYRAGDEAYAAIAKAKGE